MAKAKKVLEPRGSGLGVDRDLVISGSHVQGPESGTQSSGGTWSPLSPLTSEGNDWTEMVSHWTEMIVCGTARELYLEEDTIVLEVTRVLKQK